MKNSLKILLGAAAGTALGITLGILFAPDKGSETRKKISKKGEEFRDELGDKFDEIVDGITKKVDALREEVSHRIHIGEAKNERDVAEVASGAKAKLS